MENNWTNSIHSTIVVRFGFHNSLVKRLCDQAVLKFEWPLCTKQGKNMAAILSSRFSFKTEEKNTESESSTPFG